MSQDCTWNVKIMSTSWLAYLLFSRNALIFSFKLLITCLDCVSSSAFLVAFMGNAILKHINQSQDKWLFISFRPKRGKLCTHAHGEGFSEKPYSRFLALFVGVEAFAEICEILVIIFVGCISIVSKCPDKSLMLLDWGFLTVDGYNFNVNFVTQFWVSILQEVTNHSIWMSWLGCWRAHAMPYQCYCGNIMLTAFCVLFPKTA